MRREMGGKKGEEKGWCVCVRVCQGSGGVGFRQPGRGGLLGTSQPRSEAPSVR